METMLMLMLSFLLATTCIGSSQNKLGKPFPPSLKLLCDKYPNTCYDEYISQFQAAVDEISRAHETFTRNGMLNRVLEDAGDGLLASATESCRDSLSLALYNLDSSLPIDGGALTARESRAKFRRGVSAARADLQTCLDGFKYAPNEVRELVTSNLGRSIKLVTASLAIISKIDDHMSSYQEPQFIGTDTGSTELTSDWAPTRFSSNDDGFVSKPIQKMEVDVVVAKDGSGKYTTIAKAIHDVPPLSNKRFVIYVKKGVYNENVQVPKDKWNILMYGDGMDNTIVLGNRCNQSGSSTSWSATFAVYGNGFIAKDMGFRNSAGADKGQAVALMSASDQSVFYRCLIDGYQDTLFTQSRRQFYRECKIYGTMDFIFGEAAVVIQNSDILVKKPMNTMTTIITAQGKWNSQSNSGIVIQNCRIQAAEDLGPVKAFLGRPWKDYATVIVMESKLGSLIDPVGWSPWTQDVSLPDTVLYVEHMNSGPGAATANRVKQKGVKVRNTEMVANKYTVRSFINGDQWLPSTGVPFQADL